MIATPVSNDTPVSVEQLRDGLWAVRMPLPFRTDPVNCYVGQQDDGDLVVLDTGLALGARELWEAAFDAIGVAPSRVARVVVSHIHPDHIGGAGPLAELTDAPVAASASTVAHADPVWGSGRREYFRRVDEYFVRYGLPADDVAELSWEVDAAAAAVRLPDTLDVIDAGDTLSFAGAEWTVAATPGHADGHIVLASAASGELLAGDHVLERISPAVGKYPDHADDPLGNYLASLEQTRLLGDLLVYPGHGRPFRGLVTRVDALLQHHAERVEACLTALDDGPLGARDIALRVFGTHHDIANQRFALAETVAHLEYALARGRARRNESGRVVRYERV